MNLLRKPSCGARLCLRRQGRLANRRPAAKELAWPTPGRLQRQSSSLNGIRHRRRFGGDARHAPRASDSPTAITKNSATANAVALFLAGAEGLEPSARGFGVDVEERKRERGRGGVARFLLQDENVRCWFGAVSSFWRRIVYRLPLLPSKEKHLRQEDGQADQDHGRVGPGGI